jgi:hypothetical protein
MEEDLSRVISGAIEIIFLAGDDTGVADGAEVYTEFLMIVSSNLLIEDLRDTVNGLGLQDDVDWGVDLGEVISSKDCDCRGDKDACFVITGNI